MVDDEELFTPLFGVMVDAGVVVIILQLSGIFTWYIILCPCAHLDADERALRFAQKLSRFRKHSHLAFERVVFEKSTAA